MSDGDATGGATTYAFGDLDRRGKFFGLHLPHFVLGWLVLFSLIPILHAGSAATVVWLLIADSAVVNVAFGRLLDRGLWEWAPVLAGRACQMWMGAACDAAGRARTARTRPTRSSRPGRTVAVDFAGGRPRLGGRVAHKRKEKSYAASLRVRAGSSACSTQAPSRPAWMGGAGC